MGNWMVMVVMDRVSGLDPLTASLTQGWGFSSLGAIAVHLATIFPSFLSPPTTSRTTPAQLYTLSIPNRRAFSLGDIARSCRTHSGGCSGSISGNTSRGRSASNTATDAWEHATEFALDPGCTWGSDAAQLRTLHGLR